MSLLPTHFPTSHFDSRFKFYGRESTKLTWERKYEGIFLEGPLRKAILLHEREIFLPHSLLRIFLHEDYWSSTPRHSRFLRLPWYHWWWQSSEERFIQQRERTRENMDVILMVWCNINNGSWLIQVEQREGKTALQERTFCQFSAYWLPSKGPSNHTWSNYDHWPTFS